MRPLRVFPDTGVLLAMIVFPRDRSGGLALAGEVLEMYEAGSLELVIGRAVVDELDDVLDVRFPHHRLRAAALLAPFAPHLVRLPLPSEIEAVLPFCSDPSDAPIFASAVLARPDVMLSNDFRAFHTPQAKAFRERHQITVDSLYGLLRRLGRRR